ncbi:MAG: cation:proton antiporter [Nanoarchaeota archaeon]|nr:cation:proton antiporter [Nanoarchaeota archaeon]
MVTEVLSVFGVIAGIIFIGFIGESIFKKTKIPDVIILIIIGIILSSGLHWVDNNTFGFGSQLFVVFTLMFILFQGSINIDFKTLFKSLKGTAKLTFICFILTTLIILLISKFIIGYSYMHSLLLSIILGGTASEVIIVFADILPINKKYSSVLTLESAITDVLSIIGTITIILIIMESNITTAAVIKSVLVSFLLAIAIGIIISMAWIFLLSKSAILMEAHMVNIAVVISLYSIVESSYVGASGAIAVLTFGLMLGNSTPIINFFKWASKEDDEKDTDSFLTNSVLSERSKSFYQEISFFVKVFFFVYLGTLIDFSRYKPFLFGGLIVLGIFIIRLLAVKLSFLGESIDNNTKNALRFLLPRGLAAAVLAQLALQKGISQSKELVDIIFAVILISILVSSILIFFTQRSIKPAIPDKKARIR